MTDRNYCAYAIVLRPMDITEVELDEADEDLCSLIITYRDHSASLGKTLNLKIKFFSGPEVRAAGKPMAVLSPYSTTLSCLTIFLPLHPCPKHFPSIYYKFRVGNRVSGRKSISCDFLQVAGWWRRERYPITWRLFVKLLPDTVRSSHRGPRTSSLCSVISSKVKRTSQ